MIVISQLLDPTSSRIFYPSFTDSIRRIVVNLSKNFEELSAKNVDFSQEEDDRFIVASKSTKNCSEKQKLFRLMHKKLTTQNDLNWPKIWLDCIYESYKNAPNFKNGEKGQN